MSQLQTVFNPYPPDQYPSGIEILFNGHNVGCWCILDGKKADIDYYLNQLNDEVVISSDKLKFVDVYFDKHFVLNVNSDGVASQNNLEDFYRNQGKIFVPNQHDFQNQIPAFLIDWEWSFEDKWRWDEFNKVREKVAQGHIPF